MVADNLRELLEREPFSPFRLRLSSGDSSIVRRPELVVVMKSELFMAQPNSDSHTFVPLSHIAALEKMESTNGNGRGGPGRKRRR